jgi:hypothetical protein
MKVRLEFPNRGFRLKPEMYANVEIDMEGEENWPFRRSGFRLRPQKSRVYRQRRRPLRSRRGQAR